MCLSFNLIIFENGIIHSIISYKLICPIIYSSDYHEPINISVEAAGKLMYKLVLDFIGHTTSYNLTYALSIIKYANIRFTVKMNKLRIKVMYVNVCYFHTVYLSDCKYNFIDSNICEYIR